MSISLYSYVIKMRKPQLIDTINSQYKAIKGTWTVAPCMGEYGSIEYAAALLLWRYAHAGFNGNQKAYASLQVTLGDVIACSFFGMPAGEWSNKVDTMLNDHADILTHEEFGDVYTYLKAYFVDEIHSLEFNKGNAKREVYQQLYTKFVQIYNSANDFLDILDYYTEKGLKIKDYIDIDYKSLRQIRTTSNTPPTQPQSRQSQPTSTTPLTQAQILDEQRLLNYIKAMPVKWEFGNPDALQNESLKKLCSAFISSESVSKIFNPEMCASMELLIQQKRSRYPRTADYNKAMDVNILFELYKYAYLMAAFQVLENRKNDTLKIDRVKFWNLIQTDCHKRLENLEQEKRNNPAVCNMLQKYEHDTQKVKMVVNDYVEPREYDYICASLMTNALLPIIIDYVLGGEINIGNGYQKTLQIIRQYPASDLMAALDASLSSITSFTLGMYANGGRLPRRPQ